MSTGGNESSVTASSPLVQVATQKVTSAQGLVEGISGGSCAVLVLCVLTVCIRRREARKRVARVTAVENLAVENLADDPTLRTKSSVSERFGSAVLPLKIEEL